jgi:hypothetical protein
VAAGLRINEALMLKEPDLGIAGGNRPAPLQIAGIIAASCSRAERLTQSRMLGP